MLLGSREALCTKMLLIGASYIYACVYVYQDPPSTVY